MSVFKNLHATFSPLLLPQSAEYGLEEEGEEGSGRRKGGGGGGGCGGV